MNEDRGWDLPTGAGALSPKPHDVRLLFLRVEHRSRLCKPYAAGLKVTDLPEAQVPSSTIRAEGKVQ